MTRRNFAALRVIRLKRQSPSRMALNFSYFSTIKMAIACSSPRGISWLLFANEKDYTIFETWGVVMARNDEIFEMNIWKFTQIDFFRPCRGLSTWKGASPPISNMTRRALALRVIPLQGPFAFEWSKRFDGLAPLQWWFSLNPWIRFGPEYFFYHSFGYSLLVSKGHLLAIIWKEKD